VANSATAGPRLVGWNFGSSQSSPGVLRGDGDAGQFLAVGRAEAAAGRPLAAALGAESTVPGTFSATGTFSAIDGKAATKWAPVSTEGPWGRPSRSGVARNGRPVDAVDRTSLLGRPAVLRVASWAIGFNPFTV
jgi:hypothetical protein